MILKAILVSLIFSTTTFAQSKIKPGLWEVKMQILHDGKEFDPMAEIRKQLEKMPEAQKKMILDQMNKGGAKVNGNLTTVCYTKEMVEKPEKLSSEEDTRCKYKVTSKTSQKVVSDFNCKDGTKGTTVWEMLSPTSTKVQTDATDKNGKKIQTKYEAKFLKANC